VADHTLVSPGGWTVGPVGGRSSETYSTDVNNNDPLNYKGRLNNIKKLGCTLKKQQFSVSKVICLRK
jgi:hypothetical protein